MSSWMWLLRAVGKRTLRIAELSISAGCLCVLQIAWRLGWRPCLRILVYHCAQYSEFGVIREQLDRILSMGFRCVPLDAAVRAWASGDKQRGRICVTFDDAYGEQVELAAQVTTELSVTATIFVTWGFVGSGRRFWWAPTPVATWEQLTKHSQNGRLSYGGHTESHPDLRDCSDTELHVELGHRRVDGYVPVFAYPYGFYDERVKKAVVGAGYLGAVAVEAGRGTDLFALPRVALTGNESALGVAVRMYGSDGWKRVLKRVVPHVRERLL